MDDQENTRGEQLANAIRHSAGGQVATSTPLRAHEIPNQMGGIVSGPVDSELLGKFRDADSAAKKHMRLASHFARMANEMLNTSHVMDSDVLEESDRLIALASRHSTDMIRHRSRALALQKELEEELAKST